jgi:hypothetical protein
LHQETSIVSTTSHNRNYLATIAAEIRMATTPSLPLSAKSLDEQSADLLAAAIAQRDLATLHTKAGNIAAAQRCIDAGRAIVAQHRALGEG